MKRKIGLLHNLIRKQQGLRRSLKAYVEDCQQFGWDEGKAFETLKEMVQELEKAKRQ